MDIFGIRLVGVNAENGQKILYTLILIAAIFFIQKLLRYLTEIMLRDPQDEQRQFWTRQAINLATTLVIIIGLLSIWFDDPTRLATALGLVTAGLAFALQKVVTAIAGYFVILRGKNFTVGDRISMGGVRGDVVGIDFIQTQIMEMGQPPAVQGAPPATWVRSRQYTGRVVSVSNAKIFDEPVYNFTRDFPYLWEEIMIPISFSDDRHRAEEILLDVARRHTVAISEMSREALRTLQERYFVHESSLEPTVYFRITDNWLELAVRFIVHERGIRDLKDAASRDILNEFDKAGIGVASATFDIVGLPPLRVTNGLPKNEADVNNQ